MNKKVAWGVLGVANIAVKKVLPATQRGERCEITAIPSRDFKRAEQAAKSSDQQGVRIVRGTSG
jgi:predicted dehydrogenase